MHETISTQIRLLTIDDAADLAAHSHRCMRTSGLPSTPKFHAYSQRDLPTTDAFVERYKKAWSIPIGEPGWSRCFGLTEPGGIIRGEAGIGSTDLKSQVHRGNLWLGLEIDFRGQGMGQILLQCVIDWAAASTKLCWLDLGVFSNNHGARRLYNRLGFLEVGRTVDAFRIDDESIDDISMVLDLNQYRLN